MKPKTKQILTIFIHCFMFFLVLAGTASAQDKGIVNCGDHCQLGDLVLIVVALINYLFALSSFVAMVFIVWNAWGMITSAGNEEAISNAKKGLSNAIIGFFLVLVAWVLIDAIVAILAGPGHGLNYYFNFIPNKTP